MIASKIGSWPLLMILALAGCKSGNSSDGEGSGGGDSYQVTTVVNGSGSIQPATMQLEQGGSGTFTISTAGPNELAAISGCNGQRQGHQYLVNNLSSNCSITVTFSEAIYQPGKIFNRNDLSSDLVGELEGTVLLAQNHITPSVNSIDGDRYQHLVGLRKALVMMKPKVSLNELLTVQLTATDSDGQTLGILNMRRPHELTRTSLFVEDIDPAGMDFNYDPSQVYTSGLDNAAIALALTNHDVVKVGLSDGHWVPGITLPEDDANLDGKIFILESSAGYGSTIYYSGRSINIGNGSKVIFKNTNGTWVNRDDLSFNDIAYGDGFWSVVLPETWLKPGLSLSFEHDGKQGNLGELNIGAPSELLLHTIDVGMLVEPRKQFSFQYDKEAQREYFETVPASRMIVSEYEAVHFEEVMLPDGQLLTDYDPSEGGWHSGTMRQRIGKELISIGINNANYGIHSTIGVGESQNPYLAAQLTAHNSRGQYANGIQVHGGSGGAGMVTLDASTGNEFSHEVGHNYGLGHGVGGFAGSIHKPADMTNSTWGWDSELDVFYPNFHRGNNGGQSCMDDQCVDSFNGHTFARDSMAGGEAIYPTQRFTLYTPWSMALIQDNLESKAVFDRRSPTGFRKWNQETSVMEEYTHTIASVESTQVDPGSANAEFISTLYSRFQRVVLSTWNGHWARDIYLPVAAAENNGRIFHMTSSAGYTSYLHVNEDILPVHTGNSMTFVSNGQQWVRDDGFTVEKAIKPRAFGVPVTTLVGYYDPQRTLQTYIFKPLYGSFGYVYDDNSGAVTGSDCMLEVETQSGSVQKYQLLNNRQSADVMNKFHVNIAQSDNPIAAQVVCGGQKLGNSVIISEPAQPLSHTVQGIPLPE